MLFEIVLTIVIVDLSILSMYGLKFLKTKISSEDLENIKKWAKIGVSAAEMLFESNTEKKRYVLEFLKNKKIKFKNDEINNIIEACVQELKGGDKK